MGSKLTPIYRQNIPTASRLDRALVRGARVFLVAQFCGAASNESEDRPLLFIRNDKVLVFTYLKNILKYTHIIFF